MREEESVVVLDIRLDLLLYKQGFVSGDAASDFLGDHHQEHRYRCREACGPFEEESERHGRHFLVEENVLAHQIGKLDRSWVDRCTCTQGQVSSGHSEPRAARHGIGDEQIWAKQHVAHRTYLRSRPRSMMQIGKRRNHARVVQGSDRTLNLQQGSSHPKRSV